MKEIYSNGSRPLRAPKGLGSTKSDTCMCFLFLKGGADGKLRYLGLKSAYFDLSLSYTCSNCSCLTSCGSGHDAYYTSPSTKSSGNVELPRPRSEARHTLMAHLYGEPSSARPSCDCRILQPVHSPTTLILCWRGMTHVETILNANSHSRRISSRRSRVLHGILVHDDRGMIMLLVYGFLSCHALCSGMFL